MLSCFFLDLDFKVFVTVKTEPNLNYSYFNQVDFSIMINFSENYANCVRVLGQDVLKKLKCSAL